MVSWTDTASCSLASENNPGQPGGGVFLIRNSGKGEHDAAISYEYMRAYMNDAAWVESPTKAKVGTP